MVVLVKNYGRPAPRAQLPRLLRPSGSLGTLEKARILLASRELRLDFGQLGIAVPALVKPVRAFSQAFLERIGLPQEFLLLVKNGLLVRGTAGRGETLRTVVRVWTSRCCRGTEGGGEPLREVVPRQTLTETSRSPCVFLYSFILYSHHCFHGLLLLVADT